MQVTLPPPELPVSPSPSTGDQDLGAWVDRHLRALWRYLRMQGAAPHLADDLAHEAFVIGWQKGAHRLDPPAANAFLRRTARLLFLRQLRDRRPAVELADAVDALWARDCDADDGDGLLLALRECVDRLEGRARRAVELGYGTATVAAPDRDAVARELGLKPNGLKTLLQRVRQQLRACIERRQR